MNITVNPGRATEDVKEIKNIVTTIDRSMKELNDVIERVIPEHLETQWSLQFREEWEKYYKESVYNAMGNMLLSAVNLQNAVDKALEYSRNV